MTRRPPTPAPDETDAPDSSEEMSYIQALYTAFWKPIFFAVGMAHILAVGAMVKLIWPDAVGYTYAVAFLLVVPVAYLDFEWVARRLGLNDEPIVDWHDRSTYLMLVGFALALALAIAMAVNEANNRAAERARALENERERARMAEITNSPNYKAAEQFLRARQEQQEQQQKKKP